MAGSDRNSLPLNKHVWRGKPGGQTRNDSIKEKRL